MPAEAKHRDAIVTAAAELFQRQGFAATGMNEIVARSGAPKGSLYHYFPGGKDAIGEAAITRAGAALTAILGSIAEATDSTEAFFAALASRLGGAFERSGFTQGCPMATVLLEAAPQNQAITQAGHAALASQAAIVAEKLARDGIAPEAAQRLADFTVAAIQGGLLQARVAGSLAPLRNVFACLASLIAAEKQATAAEGPLATPARAR